MKRLTCGLLSALLALCLLLSGCEPPEGLPAGSLAPASAAPTAQASAPPAEQSGAPANQAGVSDPAQVPPFSGAPYVVLNDNQPGFTQDEITAASFESYSPLDSLGRCGTAFACVGTDLMPTEERGSIGQVKPTGWHTVKYDIVDGKYLYNRCHLIGYQLTGENANERNLITGTRYMNVEGMLPFENLVADYVQETDSHVLYRVTPWYEGDNLLASGVELEAWSVEDEGAGVCFHVYVYNSQPGIDIDYATGDSRLADSGGEAQAPASSAAQPAQSQPAEQTPAQTSYVLNTRSHVFHLPDCAGVDKMSAKNRQAFTGTREEVLAMGYTPCGQCRP